MCSISWQDARELIFGSSSFQHAFADIDRFRRKGKGVDHVVDREKVKVSGKSDGMNATCLRRGDVLSESLLQE